jgi:serine/threonine protein kinase/tetratricopeptide (TPR) repeat protein
MNEEPAKPPQPTSAGSDARAKEVFVEALDLQGSPRAEYLDGACAADTDLRRRVQALLAAAEKGDRFLSDPTIQPGGSRGVGVRGESVGDRIGHYKLLELIGEGGFGTVYMAEQERPVHRRVALKIIKLGMDTRAVVARFEQEREALAVMDHPNIAKVLDAGATSIGRPYFVMELVKGEPITRYCDRERLSITERLELFVQVCRAVQHAHTKGIIHRDIKPSNVLVASQDGHPLARVIDFGIAKATQQRLTEKTVFTEFRQLIGTPEYMSPEQADGSRDIDTRSDIYSLGVLLYELLTGSTPCDPARLRSAAYAEMQRIIREVDPPAPSTRLSQSRETLGSVAAVRRSEPARLGSMIKGELDWIVMRALEKNRSRRYDSPGSLAADIERHLSGQAVEAAPPSSVYRVRKFVGRHRGAVVAGLIVGAALLAGTTGTSIGLLRARAARADAVAHAELARQSAERADAEAANARRQAEVALATVSLLTRDLLGGADTGQQRGRADVTVREMLDRAAGRLDSGESLRSVAAEARETVKNAVRCAVARTYRALGLYDKAAEQARAAVDAARGADPAQPAALADALYELGETARARQDRDEARAALTESAALMSRAHGENSRATADVVNALAGVELSTGNYEQAEELERRALSIHQTVLGERSAEAAMLMGNLAQILVKLGRGPEGVEMLKQAAGIHRELLGEGDMQYARDIFNLGAVISGTGNTRDAEPYFREALVRLGKLYPADHPIPAVCRRNLGFVLLSLDQATEAEELFRAALEVDRKAAGSSGSLTTNSLGGLGRALIANGKFGEAESMFVELERIEADIYKDNAEVWRVQETRSRRGEAIVGGVRAALNSPGTADGPAPPTAARLREAEALMLPAFGVVEPLAAGRDRFITEKESRRCEVVRRLEELFQAWAALDELDPAHPDGERVKAELARWVAEHERLRAADANPVATSN